MNHFSLKGKRITLRVLSVTLILENHDPRLGTFFYLSLPGNRRDDLCSLLFLFHQPVTIMNSVVEIPDILIFTGGHEKRNFREGHQVFLSGNLIDFGISSGELNIDSSMEFTGLCLKTSDLKGTPHEVKVKKEVDSEGNVSLSGRCSCAAGTGKCKHVVALLFALQKSPIEEVQVLTCTSLAQEWGRLKKEGKDPHKPTCVKDMCHVSSPKLPYTISLPDKLDPQLAVHIKTELLNCFQDSAFNVHMRGRGTAAISHQEPEETLTPTLTALLENVIRTPLGHYTIEFPEECQDLRTFYESSVEITPDVSLQLCRKTIKQEGLNWLAHRQIRITGSKCYELFTYKKTDGPSWDKKLNNIVFSNEKFSGNVATQYGSEHEADAIASYEKEVCVKIAKVGLFVHPSIPWLGYSADGIISESRTLVEVKCPLKGKVCGRNELVAEVDYLEHIQGEICLKRHHKYYGQIQLGLYLLNLEKCDLLIYSHNDKKCLSVNVRKDHSFLEMFIDKLNNVYFNNYLPFLNNVKDRLLLKNL